MTDVRAATSHEERTAKQPREDDVIKVKIRKIDQANDSVRTFRLCPIITPSKIKFLAGQWLDVFVPGLLKAGGFTITSRPSGGCARNGKDSHVCLAVQRTENPPAKWFWQEPSKILHAILQVRVGGSFVWPPPHMPREDVKRLILVAGGVGINPLISILDHIVRDEEKKPDEVIFLYGTKAPTQEALARSILFVPRLRRIEDIANQDPENTKVALKLFLTNLSTPVVPSDGNRLPQDTQCRRITAEDLDDAIGPVKGRGDTLCYVCGPPAMTDAFVEYLSKAEGMHEDRVLCEKWW